MEHARLADVSGANAGKDWRVMSGRRTETGAETLEELREPPMYRVILRNDDYTPMDFVVYALMEVFHKDETEAKRIMLNVHHQGVGVCGVYVFEEAETKVAQVETLARQYGYPLKCEMEEV